MSAYKQSFAVAVKCGGNILREHEDVVLLPFGSEYSLFIKNMESRKAQVKISIDGRDVVQGGLIVNPNSDLELERFVKDLGKGNRFKFIKKTQEIVEHRGDKIDDGIIRVEFTYEKKKPVNELVDITYRRHYDYFPWPHYHYDYTPYIPNYTITCSSGGGTQSGTIAPSSYNVCSNFISKSIEDKISASINPHPVEILQDEGITVEGSISNQQFTYGYIGELEENSSVIILRLKGTTGKAVVTKPVTVQTKLKCNTCGNVSKSGSKFCSRCGTSLEIV